MFQGSNVLLTVTILFFTPLVSSQCNEKLSQSWCQRITSGRQRQSCSAPLSIRTEILKGKRRIKTNWNHRTYQQSRARQAHAVLKSAWLRCKSDTASDQRRLLNINKRENGKFQPCGPTVLKYMSITNLATTRLQQMLYLSLKFCRYSHLLRRDPLQP